MSERSSDPTRPVTSVQPDGSNPLADNHFVEFYEDDDFLVRSVSTFVSIGLGEGGAAVIIARADHKAAIEETLSRHIDLDVARERRRFVSLDAEEALARFMRKGVPDPERFDKTISSILDEVGGVPGELRLFGEMVAILWSDGNVAGAVALEDLWNGLLNRKPARLYCAYPASVLDLQGSEASLICKRHSHVLVTDAGSLR